jgi:hypothetical protein
MNNQTQEATSDLRPSHEQVSARAELLWKAKGMPNGQDDQIWLEAERQLNDEAREMIGDTGAPTAAARTSASAERMEGSGSARTNPSSAPSKKRSGGR